MKGKKAMIRYRIRIEKIPIPEQTSLPWYQRRLGRFARGAMLAIGLIVIPTVTAWAWSSFINGTAQYHAFITFQQPPVDTPLDMGAENTDCFVVEGPGSFKALDPMWVAWNDENNQLGCSFHADNLGGEETGGANETSVLTMSLTPVNLQDDVAILVDFAPYEPDLEACWNVSDDGPVEVPAGIGQIGPLLTLTLTGDEVKTIECAGTSVNFFTQLTITEAP